MQAIHHSPSVPGLAAMIRFGHAAQAAAPWQRLHWCQTAGGKTPAHTAAAAGPVRDSKQLPMLRCSPPLPQLPRPQWARPLPAAAQAAAPARLPATATHRPVAHGAYGRPMLRSMSATLTMMLRPITACSASLTGR